MASGKPLRRDRGFTYLGVLFLVVILGLALAGAAQSWSVAAQRSREKYLLWVGGQYARALQSYYQASPGLRQYPRQLDDLVEDNRTPLPRRHLRRLYPDPISRTTRWGLVTTPDGRIAGVYSLSEAPTWKRANFPQRWEAFSGRTKYAEWKFVADGGPLGEKPAAIALPGPR